MIGQTLSNAIKVLRFPMALFVVSVHADFTKGFSFLGKDVIVQEDLSYHIVNTISHSLADFAVPLFYVISGLLYQSSINKYGYKGLLKRKFHSLFIPYIIWNAIFFIAFHMKNGYTGFDFFKGLLFIPRDDSFIGCLTQPWDGPLWFLRDLMVVLLLSPIIKYLIHRYAKIYLLFLLILYMTKILPWYIVPGLSITSLLFFSIGMYLYNNFSRILKLVNYRKMLLPTFLFFSVLTYAISVLLGNASLWYNLPHSITIFLGIGAAFSIAIKIGDSQLLDELGRYSFVVFASHTLILTYIIKLTMVPFGHEISGFQTILIYFLSIAITFMLCHVLGVLISKVPRLRKTLAGGR